MQPKVDKVIFLPFLKIMKYPQTNLPLKP